MNGTNTTVIFDGSASINPENVRLYFYWGEVDLGGLPSAHNPRPHPAVLRSVFARSERATNVFVLGDYRLGLAVLEFSLRFHEVPRAGIEFWLTVATPGEVIDLLSASLAIAASPDVPRKSLVHLLAKAQEALEEGKARKAGHHLKDLLKESRRHPISSNPQAAETFRAVVDELIHALKAARADSRQIEADDHDD